MPEDGEVRWYVVCKDGYPSEEFDFYKARCPNEAEARRLAAAFDSEAICNGPHVVTRETYNAFEGQWLVEEVQ